MFQYFRVLVMPGYLREGMFESNTGDRYESVVYARGPQEAERIAVNQAGGPDRAQALFLGNASI